MTVSGKIMSFPTRPSFTPTCITRLSACVVPERAVRPRWARATVSAFPVAAMTGRETLVLAPAVSPGIFSSSVASTRGPLFSASGAITTRTTSAFRSV